MTKDEALKLALEALEANHLLIHGSETKGGLAYCMDGYYSGCFDIDSNDKQTNEAINAIKEALAQPEMYTTSQMAKDSFVEANMKRTSRLRKAMDNEHKYMNYREAFPKREYVMPVDRNEVLEEVAKAVHGFKAFEKDTMDSFAAYIRSMKQ